jgi:hypothetical protein
MKLVMDLLFCNVLKNTFVHNCAVESFSASVSNVIFLRGCSVTHERGVLKC